MTNPIYLQSYAGHGYHLETPYSTLANKKILQKKKNKTIDIRPKLYQNCFLYRDKKTNKIMHRVKPVIYEIADVSYSEFSEKYDPSFWIGRKILAVPSTATTIVTLVLHISLEIFYILSNGCEKFLYPKIKEYSKNEVRMLQYQYCIIRDLEKLSGHLFTLIGDRYGQYLLQRSLFHQEAYFISGTKYLNKKK